MEVQEMTNFFGGSDNDNIMEGGSDADQFNCGDGIDTVLEYKVSLGDIIASNREIVNPWDGKNTYRYEQIIFHYLILRIPQTCYL